MMQFDTRRDGNTIYVTVESLHLSGPLNEMTIMKLPLNEAVLLDELYVEVREVDFETHKIFLAVKKATRICKWVDSAREPTPLQIAPWLNLAKLRRTQ